MENRSTYTIQPNVLTQEGDLAINSTMFLALTNLDLYITLYNLTQLNPYVATLGVY